MSKDKPEVGDVWIDTETRFRMTCIMVSDYYCEYIEHCEKLCESFTVYRWTNIKNTSWQKRRKYLGKSRANVNDLFEVQAVEKPKKERMTCKRYCPVWNDIDHDCEIFGEHHFTPRTCPHYQKEKQDEKSTSIHR